MKHFGGGPNHYRDLPIQAGTLPSRKIAFGRSLAFLARYGQCLVQLCLRLCELLRAKC
jgi:hypothetical protein